MRNWLWQWLPTAYQVSLIELLQRTITLGQRYTPAVQHKLCKSLSYKNVNVESLANTQQEITPPDLVVDGVGMDVTKAIAEGFQAIMDTAATFIRPKNNAQQEWDET